LLTPPAPPPPPPPLHKVGKFFYENDAFAGKFEDFVNANASVVDLSEIETTGVMKLEYTALYNQYTDLFERELSEFIESKGSTVVDFFDKLRTSVEEEPDGEIAIFGQIITATADFDIFMQMMQEAARQMPNNRK
jgi:hypothetical protein